MEVNKVTGDTIFAWDGGLQEPAVIWDEQDQLFKMWYAPWTGKPITEIINGNTVTTNVWYRQIAYATSGDGISWTKYPANPIFSPLENSSTWEEPWAVDHTAIIKDQLKGYHLFYMSGQSIGHAFSENETSFVRDVTNPMIPLTYINESTKIMYGQPAAVFHNDKIYLYYGQKGPTTLTWLKAPTFIGLSIASCN